MHKQRPKKRQQKIRLVTRDPFGFSLAGCRHQAVGYGAASVHCHAGIQWKGKKELNCARLPVFIAYFSLSQWDVFFLSQRNHKTKGYTQKIWGYRILSGQNRKKKSVEVFDAKCHETIEALFFTESKWEMLMLVASFETNSQKLQ